MQLLLLSLIQDEFEGEGRKLVASPSIELVLELYPVVGGQEKASEHISAGGCCQKEEAEQWVDSNTGLGSVRKFSNTTSSLLTSSQPLPVAPQTTEESIQQQKCPHCAELSDELVRNRAMLDLVSHVHLTSHWGINMSAAEPWLQPQESEMLICVCWVMDFL